MESIISSRVANSSLDAPIQVVFFNPAVLHTFAPSLEEEIFLPLNDPLSVVSQFQIVKREHQKLHEQIQVLSQGKSPDLLKIQRLKKKKLQLREQVELLKSLLVPDIIA